MFRLLESIVRFLKNTVVHLINIIESVRASFDFCIDMLDSFFPFELIVFLVLILSAAIAFKILGREG